jgi:hypothetical protein
VGAGVAVVAALVLVFVIRKILSLLFSVAAIGLLIWAGMRLSDEQLIAANTAPEPARVVSEVGIASAVSAPTETRALPGGRAAAAPQAAPSLDSVPIAYNRPTEMRLGRAADVRMVIDSSGTTDLQAALEGFIGDIIESEAEVTSRVSAHLSGRDGLEIRPLTPEMQELDPAGSNTWQWNVIPKKSGSRTMELSIYAYPSGDAAARPVRTFTDTITVNVQTIDHLYAFAQTSEPVVGFVAAGASFLLAVWTFFRRRRRG